MKRVHVELLVIWGANFMLLLMQFFTCKFLPEQLQLYFMIYCFKIFSLGIIFIELSSFSVKHFNDLLQTVLFQFCIILLSCLRCSINLSFLIFKILRKANSRKKKRKKMLLVSAAICYELR